MREKVYCFQCHNSVYKNPMKLPNSHPLKCERVCLYCFKEKCYFHRKRLINGCRHFIAESLAKLESGEWQANQANSKRPG